MKIQWLIFAVLLTFAPHAAFAKDRIRFEIVPETEYGKLGTNLSEREAQVIYDAQRILNIGIATENFKTCFLSKSLTWTRGLNNQEILDQIRGLNRTFKVKGDHYFDSTTAVVIGDREPIFVAKSQLWRAWDYERIEKQDPELAKQTVKIPYFTAGDLLHEIMHLLGYNHPKSTIDPNYDSSVPVSAYWCLVDDTLRNGLYKDLFDRALKMLYPTIIK